MPSSQLSISLIIPAYNEAKRLPTFLRECVNYVQKHFPERWEIVVVDDGSSDDTAQAAALIVGDDGVIRLPVNSGKGAAVRAGMLKAKGEICLFADADGATAIAEEARLRAAITEGADVAIGSRAVHRGKRGFVARGAKGKSALSYSSDALTVEPIWKVRFHRHFFGRTFSLMIKWLVGLNFEDTQCGFKMFKRSVVPAIFENLQTTRFAFDVEVLVRAQNLNLRIEEVGVSWSEKQGSKVNLFTDSFRMFFEVLAIRRSLARPSRQGS